MFYEMQRQWQERMTMSTKPLVSAIIIFWNEEQFIEEAIESVFAQTYDRWELLLVDDGSSDTSRDIARRYANQHPDKVRYLDHRGHENRGMSASRNLGVRKASGKYISYLDGDDVWLPHKLEEQVAILEARPEADMVCAPLLMWHSWAKNSKNRYPDQLYGISKNGKHPYGDSLVEPPRLLALFLRYEEFIPSGFLAKRYMMARNGVCEEAFHDAYSDAVALVKLCLTAKVFVSNKSWYLYRKHEHSNTSQTTRLGKDDELQYTYLRWVETYFNQQGVKDPKLRAILRNMLFRCRHPWLKRLEQRATQVSNNMFHRTKRIFLFLTNLQKHRSLYPQQGKSDYE